MTSQTQKLQCSQHNCARWLHSWLVDKHLTEPAGQQQYLGSEAFNSNQRPNTIHWRKSQSVVRQGTAIFNIRERYLSRSFGTCDLCEKKKTTVSPKPGLLSRNQDGAKEHIFFPHASAQVGVLLVEMVPYFAVLLLQHARWINTHIFCKSQWNIQWRGVLSVCINAGVQWWERECHLWVRSTGNIITEGKNNYCL